MYIALEITELHELRGGGGGEGEGERYARRPCAEKAGITAGLSEVRGKNLWIHSIFERF